MCPESTVGRSASIKYSHEDTKHMNTDAFVLMEHENAHI